MPGAGAPRSRTSTKRPVSGKGKPAKKTARGGKGSGRGKAPPSANPFVILVEWIGRAIAAVWMVAAHAVGGAVRAVGKSARDLDPLHRRDGIGMALLGAALVVAAAVWWGLGSAVGRLMDTVVGGAFGSLAWTVPLLLALVAWRFLRHPDRNAETGRLIIGGTALVIGTLGLVHIAHGTPSPANGGDAVRAAGGLIGYFASAPLVAGLTSWVAAPLLALLCGFGLLVITGTPLHRVPNRLAELRGAGDGADADGDEAAAGDRAGRKLAGRDRGGRPQQAGTTRRCCAGQRRPGGRRDRPETCAKPARLPARVGCPPNWPGARPRAATRACSTCSGSAPLLPGGRDRRPRGVAGSARGEQLTLAASSDSSYTLPPAGAAAAGYCAQGADARQRRGSARAHRGARPVRRGRPGHRVQPRADGHQV